MSSRIISYINDVSEYITSLKYGEHDETYRNRFIKYYYTGILYQYRFIINDYLKKNKYKIIRYGGEFGPELKYVIPFAYWHHLNGTLKKTISSKNTKELYYFSDNHEELIEKRNFCSYRYGIPNSEDHNIKYNFRQWKRVPYKEIYNNDIITFDKPILIIANKYNIEWGRRPVNYLDSNLLIWIFDNYSEKYQIIYNRPTPEIIINDNSDILPFDDLDLIKKDYPNIIDMNKLYNIIKDERINNFNHFQLLLYSNASKFVSVHGGASVLASYFKGINIIYSKKGHEHYFNEFENFYPILSGAKILHAKSNEDVINYMKMYY